MSTNSSTLQILEYLSPVLSRQLHKNISMLFLFPVKDCKLSTGVNATFDASCYGGCYCCYILMLKLHRYDLSLYNMSTTIQPRRV